MKRIVAVLKEFWDLWNKVKPERMAAALAFFGMFSFVPLLYIALTVASFFLNNSVLVDEVMTRIANILGPETADFIRSMLANTAQKQSGGSLLTSLIGLAVLLYAASRMFTTLEDMLNTIWGNPSPANQGVLADYPYPVSCVRVGVGSGVGVCRDYRRQTSFVAYRRGHSASKCNRPAEFPPANRYRSCRVRCDLSRHGTRQAGLALDLDWRIWRCAVVERRQMGIWALYAIQ